MYHIVEFLATKFRTILLLSYESFHLSKISTLCVINPFKCFFSVCNVRSHYSLARFQLINTAVLLCSTPVTFYPVVRTRNHDINAHEIRRFVVVTFYASNSVRMFDRILLLCNCAACVWFVSADMTVSFFRRRRRCRCRR